jgi:hypothetical protein
MGREQVRIHPGVVLEHCTFIYYIFFFCRFCFRKLRPRWSLSLSRELCETGCGCNFNLPYFAAPPTKKYADDAPPFLGCLLHTANQCKSNSDGFRSTVKWNQRRVPFQLMLSFSAVLIKLLLPWLFQAFSVVVSFSFYFSPCSVSAFGPRIRVYFRH